MLLQSADGAWVALSPVGYELPYDGPPTAGRDTDANWLMIEGTVRRATGEVFTFRDPCLLTVEALELGSWLKEAAAGLIAPSPQHNERDLLVFLEPNIAFSVEAWNLEEVVMRVHLSLEASPPWAEPDTELFDTIERLRLSPADVHVGADAWLAELAAFPLR